MNLLYLVRHGENRANLTLEFSSRRVDYPLTPKGVLQAQQTAECLAPLGVNAVYCSPLKRAVQTAGIIARRLGLGATVMENFREIDVGDLELQPPTRAAWEQHDRIFLDWVRGDPSPRFPGGDDYHSLWGRMSSGIQAVAHGRDGQKIVVVAHGGIFTATLKDLCPGIDMEEILPRLAGNCSITRVELDSLDGQPPRGRLLDWASCAHLSGEAASLTAGLPSEGTFPSE